jgi:hypothetical protein
MTETAIIIKSYRYCVASKDSLADDFLLPLFGEKMANTGIFYCTPQFSFHKTLEPNLHQLSLWCKVYIMGNGTFYRNYSNLPKPYKSFVRGTGELQETHNLLSVYTVNDLVANGLTEHLQIPNKTNSVV